MASLGHGIGLAKLAQVRGHRSMAAGQSYDCDHGETRSIGPQWQGGGTSAPRVNLICQRSTTGFRPVINLT
jgi:hypothetical protein